MCKGDKPMAPLRGEAETWWLWDAGAGLRAPRQVVDLEPEVRVEPDGKAWRVSVPRFLTPFADVFLPDVLRVLRALRPKRSRGRTRRSHVIEAIAVRSRRHSAARKLLRTKQKRQPGYCDRRGTQENRPTDAVFSGPATI